FIPVLAAADEKEPGNTLGISGEFTKGKGYADEFPSWTGNLPQLSTAVAATQPNLDAGQGGFDSNNAFQLVDLRTWNLQAQYHLPHEWQAFVTVGYGQLYSDNAGTLTPSTGKVPYTKAETYFANVFKDVTKQ